MKAPAQPPASVYIQAHPAELFLLGHRIKNKQTISTTGLSIS